MIPLIDNYDTYRVATTSAALEAAKRSDTVVYAVYAGNRSAPKFPADLAHVTGGQVFENSVVGALRATFTNILAEFRERYLVTYSPSGVAPGGWHELKVTIKNRRAIVKVRPGYMRGARPA